MNIFVYSDESGVFDKKNNDIFVFGGLIYLSKKDKDASTRKYKKAEKTIRSAQKYGDNELKAWTISNKHKGQLFRSLNAEIKFGIVIDQRKVSDKIFELKKSKQRYLDYAFKIGLKKALQMLISQGKITKDNVENIYIYVDEHTTATNGIYELKESIENEFKNGTHNFEYMKFFPPLFTSLKGVDLHYCNSETHTQIRASDIVANRIYYKSMNNEYEYISERIICTYLP